jgi:hypothetical protein
MQEASIVRFPGSPKELAPRYAEGLRQFAEAHPGLRPDAIFLGQSDATPNRLVVVLLWPEGIGHETIGRFLLPRLRDLGLERPEVEHLSVERAGFEAMAALRP